MSKGFSPKYIQVYSFMEYLLKFREFYPEIDYAIEGMKKSHEGKNRNGYCPFRSMNSDTIVSRIKELYGATFPILLWNIDFEEVKVISWHYPFLLLVNNWYDDYEVHHKRLGDEIIHSSMYVPKELVIEKEQSTFVLRKI